MGTGGSKSLRCPKCKSFHTKDGTKFYDHVRKEHFDKTCLKCTNQRNDIGHSNVAYEPNPPLQTFLKCPECGIDKISNEADLLTHMKDNHAFTSADSHEVLKCPECYVHIERENLMSHMKVSHFQQQLATGVIVCPLCSEETPFKDSKSFISHLERKHKYVQNNTQTNLNQNTDGKRLLPRVGDRILAMWGQSKWQYFHATITRFIQSSMRYEIDWDDGDTTGRTVDYFNIAVDKVPDKNEIGMGSIILFGQGRYKASGTQLTGGLRWHQGKITEIYRSPDGTCNLYNGVHTKGKDDGKFVTYKDYSYEFTGYKLEDLRVGPNVFEILDDMDDADETSFDDIDIYFSLEATSNQISVQNENCDPKEIENLLKSNGLKVVSSDLQGLKSNLKKKARMMRDSKVFIACISNDYALDAQCRMEFQYAKSTLKKPVVPLVFGKDMDWTKSVVGMLIAGELYIHMKDKTVQEQKLGEIFDSINAYIGSNETLDTIANTTGTSNISETPGDIFISYCWTNSYLAKESKQIDNVIGTNYSDPRLVANELSSNNYATWLDIERLKSANQGAGLFEQLTTALTEAKVVVAFVSDEYAESKNCQMEFQFSLKSLNKPVIPVIVGKGNAWEKTVVGLLLSTKSLQIVDLRGINEKYVFDAKLEQIKNKITENLRMSSVTSVKQAAQEGKIRAPRTGDHVISHHFKYCYYMATVVEFDRENMEYTVAWDDGDTTGTVQDYNQVALDIVPDEEDVGVGSYVFFVQGSYVINGTPGIRYHEGIVTNVTSKDGKLYFDGHHRYGEDDGKYCGFRYYSYTFENLELSELRIAPSALDLMLT